MSDDQSADIASIPPPRPDTVERNSYGEPVVESGNGRFRVINRSESGHCCFEATVIDTTKPAMDGDGKHMFYRGRFHFESVCECFDVDEAKMIADALNQREPQ